jgi:transcriptional regulator with XRE-family HTH domain
MILTLKDRIDQILKSRNMTTEELLKKAELSRSTYYNQFNKNEDVKLGHLRKIAEVLSLTVSELIGDVDLKTAEDITQEKLDLILKNQQTIIEMMQKKNEFSLQ